MHHIPQRLLDCYNPATGLRYDVQPRHRGLYRLGCVVLAGALLCVLAAFVTAR